MAAASRGTVGPLLAALRETGAIGSTARQLAARLEGAPDDVASALDVLEDRGEVVRIGRGLYILRSFEDLDRREDFPGPVEYTERFVAEGGVLPGTYDGPITFSSNEALPVHRWWPYVQGYSAEFVRRLLEREALPRGACVLDPFSGSGTTVVEARAAGFRGLGAELLPPAVLAARVKTRFELDPDALGRAARAAVVRAGRRRAGPPPFLRETGRHFRPEVLGDLTRLRDALPPEGSEVADALRVAFGRILIPVSRLRRSPCLGYGGPEAKPGVPPPFEAFLAAVGEMQEDLRSLAGERARWGPRAEVRRTDARRLGIPKRSVQLAVTSPPYVNGMDYVMNYKLDLAWLGYAASYADLARLRGELVACDNLPRADAARYLAAETAPDPWLPELLERLRTNVERKGSYRRNDAHAIVNRYFLDLVPVLRGVFDALTPSGRFAVVVGDSLLAGVYVPGDLLLARLGARVGFRIESVEVARPRRSGQRRSFRLRESIVTLARPGSAG